MKPQHNLPAPVRRSAKASDRDVLDLFCRALDEVNRLDRRPVCSSIEYVMRQYHGSLDLAAQGFADVEALAAEAERRGLVHVARNGTDKLVKRAGTATVTATASGTADYRSRLERKMRCALPPAAVRERIYASVATILSSRPPGAAPLSLVDLSYRTAGRLDNAATQPSIFKLLFALVLANAFVMSRHVRLHDIRVSGPAVPVDRWDDLFVATCLAGLQHDRPECPMNPASLAAAFDVPTATVRKLLSAFARQGPHAILMPRKPRPNAILFY